MEEDKETKKKKTVKTTSANKTSNTKTTTKKGTTAKKSTTKTATKKKTTTAKKTVKKEVPPVKEEIVVHKVEKKEENKSNTSEKTYTGLEISLEIVLVYLLPILGLILSFMNDKEVSKRAKFAYNQSGAVFIISVGLLMFCIIPFLGLIFLLTELVLYVFVIIALIKGYQGEDYRIIGVAELADAIWNKSDNKEEK